MYQRIPIFIQQDKLASFTSFYRSLQILSNKGDLLGFATGLEKDISAVENAVSSDLGNGFVDGTNSKLKMVNGPCTDDVASNCLKLS